MLFLFHSWEFIIFFIVVFGIYWAVPHKFRNLILLIASYIFYGSWDWRFLALILTSTYVDYFCGKKIYQEESKTIKRSYLLASLIVNLSLLGVFKYFNFFLDSLVSLLNSIGMNLNYTTLNIILPIGISFYTFQTLSYTIDIYRGKLEPDRNIIRFSLFVAYFPQLIAGPIERARDLLPKLKEKKDPKQINYREGIHLFLYGLFKKVVIADSVGRIADNVFSMADPTGAQVLIASYAFAVQIYCDFSGYSNMARGISRFFGIKLSTNFNLPYLAKDPSDFWRRWHITLSTWVRDYIYIPLGGNRSRFFGLWALVITWFLMGLWHGAAWNFVLWGLYWALLIFIYRLIKKTKFKSDNPITRIIQRIILFHLTCYGWIIFRAQSLGQIKLMTTALFRGISLAQLFDISYLYLYVIIVLFLIYEIIQFAKNDQLFIYRKGFYIQMVYYLIMFFMFIEIGAVSDARFIYFQF